MGSRKAHEGVGKVYDAAEKWIDCALRNDDSLFTPGKPIWSRDCLVELRDQVLERPDVGEGNFYEKLKTQLKGCSAEAYQLMAEALYVHFLFISEGDMRGDTKKERVERVLQWGALLSTVPRNLVSSLSLGLGGPGHQFLIGHPFHVGFIIEFVDQWKELAEDERDRLLDDPWAFKDFVSGIAPQRKLFREKPAAHRPQLHALLHLVCPDAFEGIVSVGDKEKIANTAAYASYITEPTDDVDRKIAQIREGLERELRRDFDFYHHDIQVRWDPDLRNWDLYVQRANEYINRGTLEADEIDYKREMARELSEARKDVNAESEEWFDSLKRAFRSRGGHPVSWQSADKFRKWCTENEADALTALQAIWSMEDLPIDERIRRFSAALPRTVINGPGTRTSLIAALLMGINVEQCPPYMATVFRDAYRLVSYPNATRENDEAALYCHALEFLDSFIEEASKRGLKLRHRLDAQSVVWQIQDWDESEPPDLARELFLTEPPDFLNNIESLLADKKQVIFQGPPGTGKTYVAQKLAKHLAGSEDRVTLVQFHPSYAYEDFVRGYRPILPANGQPGYELKEGPLLHAAERARKDETRHVKHFLVIDEINRGNLAKIFGELYFLLEYREEKIKLQYQRDDEDFSLPSNLYIIGTMNTADRSIALVDLALRRRFYFVEFHPDEEPVKGVLRRWLEANGKSNLMWVAYVVDRANELLKEDRHAAIGPSYFMKPSLDETMVERIWKHSVLPYIEERRFGGEEVSQEFGLGKLRDETRSAGNSADSDGDQTNESDIASDVSD